VDQLGENMAETASVEASSDQMAENQALTGREGYSGIVPSATFPLANCGLPGI